jgi:hypothetical protein
LSKRKKEFNVGTTLQASFLHSESPAGEFPILTTPKFKTARRERFSKPF